MNFKNISIQKSQNLKAWRIGQKYLEDISCPIDPSPPKIQSNFHSKSSFEFNEVNLIQICWTKYSFENSNPSLWFQKFPWFKVVGLNLNPSTKFQIFLFRKGLNLSEFRNLLKSKSLGSNFIYESKSIFDFQMNFKTFLIKFPFFEKYSNLHLNPNFESKFKLFLLNFHNPWFNSSNQILKFYF